MSDLAIIPCVRFRLAEHDLRTSGTEKSRRRSEHRATWHTIMARDSCVRIRRQTPAGALTSDAIREFRTSRFRIGRWIF